MEDDALYIPLIAICGLRFCTAILLMVNNTILIILPKIYHFKTSFFPLGAIFNVWRTLFI